MKYKIVIDPDFEDGITVHARERSEILDNIEALLSGGCDDVFGYTGEEIVKLDVRNVECFTVEDGKVYALCDGVRYSVKERLYQLEERFASSFMKINQSCIVNERKIARFKSSIGGALMIVTKGGYTDYISRRQLKFVKERMGF